MADSSIETSPATPGGKALDAESIGATPLYRERVQVTGNVLAEVARVKSATPATSDYGLVTRNIPAAPSTSDLTAIAINASSIGSNVLITGMGGLNTNVFKLFLVVASAVTVQFTDSGGSTFTGVMSLSAGGSIVLDFDTRAWFRCQAAQDFRIILGSAVQVSGAIYYTQS